MTTQTANDQSPDAVDRHPKWIIALVLAAAVLGVAGFLIFRAEPVTELEPGKAAAWLDTRGSKTQEGSSSREGSSKDASLAVLTTAAVKDHQAATARGLDPTQDGWDSEVLAESAKQHLLHLAKQLAVREPIEAAAVGASVSPEFTCGPLRPEELVEVYRDRALVVRRAGEPESSTSSAQQVPYHNTAGLAQALTKLARPFAAARDVHVHIKVIRVTLAAGSAQTTAYFEAGGQTADGSVQQRATWRCDWERQADGALQLVSLHSENYEEVEQTGTWLVDCTESVLGGNQSFTEQLAYGLNHWLGRVERMWGMQAFARWGIAVGDVNGDGLDDMYACQPGGLPNRLFVQNLDGTATDRSAAAGVDWLDHTSSALFVDLDNDGDQDLVIAAYMSGVLLMENDSTGRFQLKATLAPVDTDLQSISAADYDQDGDLDLYVCLDFAKQAFFGSEPPVPFIYFDANDGGTNALFRNDISQQSDGSWKWTDVTEQTGLDVDNRRHSLACAWEDYDNDGDQDLYVANDYGQNCLYRNDGGQFKNLANDAGVVDFGSGMSVSWGDYNRDGQIDLYVANMFSSAGNRITRQRQFQQGAMVETRAILSRFAKGNTLFTNLGQGKFHEVDAEAGVEMGRWAWSSLFADLNNDTWADLLVANGYITTEDTGDL